MAKRIYQEIKSADGRLTGKLLRRLPESTRSISRDEEFEQAQARWKGSHKK